MAQAYHTTTFMAIALITTIGTSTAVRLAAFGLFKSHRYQECLTLLNEQRSLFPHQKLPTDLRRIRIECQRRLGIVPNAIAEAEELAREQPTVGNLITLAQLYFDKGDRLALVVTARRLQDHPELDVQHALQLAQYVHLEDRQLAIALWQQALEQGVPDNLVASAMGLGFQLGQEETLAQLMPRIQALAAEGRAGLFQLDINDFPVFAQETQERTAKLEAAYQAGQVPVHVIAALRNQSLADLYHRWLLRPGSAPIPQRQPSLLIRHGGRPDPMASPSFEGALRLHLDVTALLLTAHLGLLDVVEQTFGPIYIPQALIPALTQMRNELVNHQPSRLEIAQQLVALEARRMLSVVEAGTSTDEYTSLMADLDEEWVALFEAARKADGYLVDFSPLRRVPVEREIALPEDFVPYVVNCRTIVEALRKYGPLSQTEYEQVLRALGTEGAVDPSPTLPTSGATLVFYGTVVEQLAAAGVLETVCDRFRVLVTATELANAHSSVQYEPIRQVEITWLTTLVDRINQGVDRGMYVFIPDVHVQDGEESDRSRGFAERSLFALLQFQTIPGDVIWVDDRYVTSYPHRVGAPIVGISEILAWLVEQNALSSDGYFALLLQLRAANVHFIPLEANEILHHLQEARVENGAVIETQPLQILRRHIAAALLQCRSIQRPPLPESAPNQWGELAFLAQAPRTIIDALTMVWDTAPDREMAQAWSEWILRNLYIDDLGTRVLASLPDLSPGSLYAMALTLTSLLNRSLGRVELGTARAGEIDGYTDWIVTRVINPWLTVEPNLAPAIAEIVGHIIVDLDVGELTEAQAIIKTLYLRKFYQTLPPQIREELQHNAEVLARVGRELIVVVNINGWQFERAAFFLAASKAFNGRQETVVPFNSQFAVVFRPSEAREKDVAFVIDSPVTGQVERVKDDVLRLLDESITEREAILRCHRYWFDGAESVDEVIAEIASLENPEQRVDEVLGRQARSAFVYYSQLKERLHGTGELYRSEFLPPHPEGLLPYLRLHVEPRHDEDFTTQLAHATQRLLLDVGVHETLTRLTGLPVPIPLPLLQALEILPFTEQRALIKQFLRGGSPLTLIHGVHLLVRLGSAVPRFRRLARRLVKHLLSDQGRAEVNAFLILLRWVNEELNFQSNIRQWPTASRLAAVWAHAHVIWTLCLRVAIPSRRIAVVNQLQDVFGQPHDRIPYETFERARMYWFDRAHPLRINSVVFLIDGLGYSLDEAAPDFIDPTTQALLQSLAFPLHGEMEIPAASLLLHSASGYNSLDSFFGGDRGAYLAPFVGEEIAGQFHESQLDEYLAEAVSRIVQSNTDESGWLGLYIVLDDLPPPQEIAEVIDTQVRQTDFTQLVQQDLEKGMTVVRAATNQAFHLSDDAQHYLLEQIVHIAAYLATLEFEEVQAREADAALPHPVGILLQVASQASYISEDPKVVLATFSSLLSRVLTAWPALIPVCRPWIQRLWEHLPSEQGQYLWPIIMMTRAAS